MGPLLLKVTNGLSASMHGKERLYSLKLLDAIVSTFSLIPYEAGTEHMNKMLERSGDDALRHNTMRDLIERQGIGMVVFLDGQARDTLQKHGFDPETLEKKEDTVLPASITHPAVATMRVAEEMALEAIREYNASDGNRYKIAEKHANDPLEKKVCARPAVFISIDGVFVKKQKDERGTREEQEALRKAGKKKKCGPRGRKKVEDIDVVIECEALKHYITMPDLKRAMRATLAFLLENDLLGDRMLTFFTDGEKALKKSIDSIFSFRTTGMQYDLDYFHTSHKINEVGSMAFKMSKEEKNKVYAHLRGMLWTGDIDGIKTYVRGLDKSLIKNARQQEYLVDYFSRKGPNMPCYALRGLFGLKNSSNAVEKANDILVSKRQKGLGMAFSNDGSIALASLAAAQHNGQLRSWLTERKLSLTLVA